MCLFQSRESGAEIRLHANAQHVRRSSVECMTNERTSVQCSIRYFLFNIHIFISFGKFVIFFIIYLWAGLLLCMWVLSKAPLTPFWWYQGEFIFSLRLKVTSFQWFEWECVDKKRSISNSQFIYIFYLLNGDTLAEQFF